MLNLKRKTLYDPHTLGSINQTFMHDGQSCKPYRNVFDFHSIYKKETVENWVCVRSFVSSQETVICFP